MNTVSNKLIIYNPVLYVYQIYIVFIVYYINFEFNVSKKCKMSFFFFI